MSSIDIMRFMQLLINVLQLAVVISTIYWTLLFASPNLILRKEEALSGSSSPSASKLMRIPMSMDIALHAVPAISLLLDFFLLERKYTPKQAAYGGFIVAAISGFWYAWWVEECAKYNGICEYMFLDAPTTCIHETRFQSLIPFSQSTRSTFASPSIL